ncbi:Transcriptional regulator ClgR [Sulfitobacter indolifex]|uniref:Transcriptional regulator, XRE family with cupin sensor domain n=1 Tax=Sulfitobacter indolifex HEL-45 TaxID=391624 RepID=A0ABP2DBX6_9RHOB|nr:helix-turn-helix domain-containing protein [Sulfitobacter indolifex]EDQ05769.1 transcriptional regulator, XRE family with cupin sensor domain [Sulfitobacter indolifex HEL-45]UOA19940.1 Transcriptional regulator ClgR [Sulfitobacter indolifex]
MENEPAKPDRAEAESDNTLGRRLRQRRKVRNMSLKDIAAKAQVSVGLISQVERGISMPSVKTLSAICNALEMPVSWLFDGGGRQPGQVVVRRHQRRFLDLGSKGMIKELMTPDSCSGIQMMRLVIRPGGSSGEKPYNHGSGAKCGTVVSGLLALEVNGVVHKVEAGDSFAFDATEHIRFWALGDVEADLFWVVAPAVY